MTETKLMEDYLASGGSLSGETLDSCAREVWAMMLSESRGRIATVPEENAEGSLVRQAFFSLVELAAETAQGEVQTETLGQWSRTYRDSGRQREAKLRMLLRQYLGETGLLYRGWDQ
jgi:hypothetical protein